MKDTEKSVYDVKMQTNVKKDLPKRSRYYQSMIDLDQIEKGAKYSELKKSFINLPVYTFEKGSRRKRNSLGLKQ